MDPISPLSDARVEAAWSALARSSWRAPVLAAAAGRPVSIVGGALRDAALGRPVADVDLVVDGDGEGIARRAAAALPGRFVALGGDRFGAYRVVGDSIELDFWDRSGMSARADLERRDLTINAIAMDLATGVIDDPFAGRADLASRTLRAVGATSFLADPLRVLRLARLAAELPGFSPDPATIALARAAVVRLDEVASERRRHELQRLFASPSAARGQEVLEAIGAWPRCWSGTARSGAARTAAAAIEAVARLAVETAVADGEAVRLARLAAGLAPLVGAQGAASGAEVAARRGLLTRDERVALEAILSAPPSPPADEAAMRRLLHRLGPLWPAAFLLRGATSTGSDAASWRAAFDGARGLLSRSPEILAPARLVDGHEVAALLALPPGRELGAALAALRIAQVEGRVRTRAEAEEFLLALSSRPDRARRFD